MVTAVCGACILLLPLICLYTDHFDDPISFFSGTPRLLLMLLSLMMMVFF